MDAGLYTWFPFEGQLPHCNVGDWLSPFFIIAFYTAIFSLLASLILSSQFFFCFVHNNSTYLPRIGLWRRFTMIRNLGQGFFLHFYSAHCIYCFLSPLSITATRDTSYMIERFYSLPTRV